MVDEFERRSVVEHHVGESVPGFVVHDGTSCALGKIEELGGDNDVVTAVGGLLPMSCFEPEPRRCPFPVQKQISGVAAVRVALNLPRPDGRPRSKVDGLGSGPLCGRTGGFIAGCVGDGFDVHLFGAELLPQPFSGDRDPFVVEHVVAQRDIPVDVGGELCTGREQGGVVGVDHFADRPTPRVYRVRV